MSDSDTTADGDGGSRLRQVGLSLGLAVGGIVVVVVVLALLGIVGVPDAGLEDNRWGEVEGQEVNVTTEIGIDNPNPFGFGGSADVVYDIELQDVRLAEGQGTGLDVASGQSSENLTTTLFAENLPPWWSSHLNNGEQSRLLASASADVSLGPLSGSYDTNIVDGVVTDIEGALDETSDEFEGEYSLTRSGLAVEPSVTVENATTRWGQVTEERTEIVTTISVRNDNPYPIPTPAFAGDIVMNGEDLANWSAGEVQVLDAEGDELVGDEAFIPPGETEERTFVAEMDNQNVAVWFPTHVDSQQPESDPGVEFTEMVVTAQLAFEINGERLTIPPGDQAVACEFGLTTAIFVDQDQGTTPQGCSLTPFEQPRDQLEAAGAVLDLDDDEGVLPARNG
jgi:LEA14-like dessication related protein